MKIKSINLTSKHEIENSVPNRTVIGASKAPVYQIEYEESTPTGLKTTGTMLLDTNNEEKVNSLFKELEESLIEPYLHKEIKGINSQGKVVFSEASLKAQQGKITSNSIKWDSASTEKNKEDKKEVSDAVTNIVNVFIEAVEKVNTKEIDSFIKQINDRLKRNQGMR